MLPKYFFFTEAEDKETSAKPFKVEATSDAAAIKETEGLFRHRFRRTPTHVVIASRVMIHSVITRRAIASL